MQLFINRPLWQLIPISTCCIVCTSTVHWYSKPIKSFKLSHHPLISAPWCFVRHFYAQRGGHLQNSVKCVNRSWSRRAGQELSYHMSSHVTMRSKKNTSKQCLPLLLWLLQKMVQALDNVHEYPAHNIRSREQSSTKRELSIICLINTLNLI